MSCNVSVCQEIAFLCYPGLPRTNITNMYLSTTRLVFPWDLSSQAANSSSSPYQACHSTDISLTLSRSRVFWVNYSETIWFFFILLFCLLNKYLNMVNAPPRLTSGPRAPAWRAWWSSWCWRSPSAPPSAPSVITSTCAPAVLTRYTQEQ